MRFDFCFAAYNSEKWLCKCVQALAKLNYDKSQIGLYFADNASQDNTVKVLNELKLQYQNLFGKFELISMPSNRGFGTASNAAARAGSGEYVFFFNIDTEICANALLELDNAINASSAEFAAFELRQFPYEHPKYYDPITMEVSWASGADFVLRRDVFSKIGGFDQSIFMYAEDVELSWRLRLFGYKIKYVPSAVTFHYAYKEAGEVKPSQLAGGVSANLLVRYKYGSFKDIKQWQILYENSAETFNKVPAAKELLQKQLAVINENKKEYRKFYNKYVKHSKFVPQFLGFDYEFARDGAFFVNEFPEILPKFSVLVRTFKRPEVLRLTLKSLKNQTYKNFEVILVEDGANPVSETVAKEESAGLELKYYPLKKQMGRCKAGNFAIEKASGDFLVFLDDDDYFFADALEIFAELYQKNPECSVLATGAIEAKCEPLNESGTQFVYKNKKLRGKNELSMFDFSYENPLPIQAIAFKKELATKYGGLDIQLDALEDWDLWQRFVWKEKIACTAKSTSIYKVPSEEKSYGERDTFIAKYRNIMLERMSRYSLNVTASDIYGLLWQKAEIPEITGSTSEESKAMYKKALQASINEITHSKTWRFFAIIRWPVFALLYPVLWLFQGLSFCFGQVARAFAKVKALLQNALDFVSPVPPNFDKANEVQLDKFITLSKLSLGMNLFKK